MRCVRVLSLAVAAWSVAIGATAAGGSSGIDLSPLFEKKGIASQIKPKAVLVPGALAALRDKGMETP